MFILAPKPREKVYSPEMGSIQLAILRAQRSCCVHWSQRGLTAVTAGFGGIVETGTYANAESLAQRRPPVALDRG